MASGSNNGFWNGIPFQSPVVNSSTEMMPMSNLFGASTSSTGVIPPASSGMNAIDPNLFQAGSSSGNLLLDSVSGLNNDGGLSVEWSAEEQYKLEEGLERFRDEPRIMKYIKIAAILRDKTARDVAFRCRWMKAKRRKFEEPIVGKKLVNRKFLQDKPTDSSPKLNMPSDLPRRSTIFPPFIQHVGQNSAMPREEGLSGVTMHLLQQNAQAFSQISSNLSTWMLEDNISLFCQTRNNLTSILNGMRDKPGILSHMPPLPVSINEDLVNTVLLNSTQLDNYCTSLDTQPAIFDLPAGINLKHVARS